ncbi:MAG TPA: SMR family transporter [Chitinophagaceae bacterium]|nr:SMR family transporter [Chitinophagaceae bacterium]
MAWLYLFIASMFEIGWTFSIKFLSLKSIAKIPWRNFFDSKAPFMTLLPLLGYIFLGLGNIIFFSMAIKQIPASTAMAVWIGVALIGVKIVDVTVFKQGYSFGELFFFGIILVGLIGLKSVTPPVK